MLGRRPEVLRSVMLVLLALTIVVSLQTVGVGLVAALLVTPAATAYLLTRRLPAMMAVAALIGAASSVTGLYSELLPGRGVGGRRGAHGHGGLRRGVPGRAAARPAVAPRGRAAPRLILARQVTRKETTWH